MIVFAARLFSARGRGFDRDLGSLKIANDGTATRADGSAARAKGNYDAVLMRSRRARPRSGRVEGFPRKSRSAWELLRRALNDMHERGEMP